MHILSQQQFRLTAQKKTERKKSVLSIDTIYDIYKAAYISQIIADDV